MAARWTRNVLLVLLAVLIGCAGVVYAVDPYQYYRLSAWFAPTYYNSEEAYFNAGLALHSDYDAVILGTSMVENFRPSLVDATFGTHSIKLPFEGGMAVNHAKVMRLAFDSHDVRRVFYGLDMYSFVRDPDYSAFVMPGYLYDGDPFSDVQYLLNGDMLCRRIPGLLWRRLRGEFNPTDRDAMYAWSPETRYDRAVALSSYDFTKPAQPMLPEDAFEANVRANFDLYVRPFLEARPDTSFSFFYPPYSALQWYIMGQAGHLDAVLRTKSVVTELLLPYANVKVFDFTAHLPWIENLDLYTDYAHYSPKINDAMTEALAGDDFRVRDIAEVTAHNATLVEVAEGFPVPGAETREGPPVPVE